MPPETQLSTSTPSSPVSTRPPAAAPAVTPGRMAAVFAELILDDAPSDEFFRRFLLQVVRTSAAGGGALWLVESKGKDQPPDFRLESFLELSKSGFDFGFDPLTPGVLSCLQQVFNTRQKLVVYPTQGTEPKDASNPNRSNYAWFFSSIDFRGGVLGVIVLFLETKWAMKEANNRVMFIDHLGQYVSTHLLLRRKSQAAKTGKVAHKLLEFSSGIVGELRREELAIFIAAEARDVAGCNRASVFEYKVDKWVAVSVSGNDEIDRASRLVTAMKDAFSDLAEKGKMTVLNFSPDKEDPDVPASVTKFIAATNTRSILAIVMYDARDRKAFGIMLESENEGHFQPSEGVVKGLENADSVSLSLWVAEKAGKALLASRTHQSIPFSSMLIRMQNARLALAEDKGKRLMRFWGIVFAILLIISVIPWKERAVGECSLLPTKRAVVVAETTGRLTEVSVKEGTLVAADQSVAKLDTLSLETNLEIAHQERMRFEADVRRYQSAGDMPAYQASWHQARKASEQENKLQQDIARAELRSPIAGIILTKDVELRRGEVLPIGKEFCEIASLEDWNLQIDIDEADFGVLQDALRNGQSVEVEYILFARSGMKLHTKINSVEQLSQMAYTKGTENIFYATVTGIPLPAELQHDIRPGFSGKARVIMSSRPLFRVISRKFIHFLRVHFLV